MESVLESRRRHVDERVGTYRIVRIGYLKRTRVPESTTKRTSIPCLGGGAGRGKGGFLARLDHTHAVARRLGFAVLPLTCITLHYVCNSLTWLSVSRELSRLAFWLVVAMVWLSALALKILTGVCLAGVATGIVSTEAQQQQHLHHKLEQHQHHHRETDSNSNSHHSRSSTPAQATTGTGLTGGLITGLSGTGGATGTTTGSRGLRQSVSFASNPNSTHPGSVSPARVKMCPPSYF